MLFVGAAVGTIKQTLSGDIKYSVGWDMYGCIHSFVIERKNLQQYK